MNAMTNYAIKKAFFSDQNFDEIQNYYLFEFFVNFNF